MAVPEAALLCFNAGTDEAGMIAAEAAPLSLPPPGFDWFCQLIRRDLCIFGVCHLQWPVCPFVYVLWDNCFVHCENMSLQRHLPIGLIKN